MAGTTIHSIQVSGITLTKGAYNPVQVAGTGNIPLT
jgi:hypothetical protein